jgi:hypothetical protein
LRSPLCLFEPHARWQSGAQVRDCRLSSWTVGNPHVNARQLADEPHPFLCLRNIRQNQRVIPRLVPGNRSNENGGVGFTPHVDREGLIDSQPELLSRARCHHHGTWLREPTAHIAGHRPNTRALRIVQGGGGKWIDTDELQGPLADADVSLDDRSDRGRSRSQPQINIQPLIETLRPPNDRVRCRAIHRLHRQLKSPSGARSRNIHRNDGTHANGKPHERQHKLRRMAQQVPDACRPKERHQDSVS